MPDLIIDRHEPALGETTSATFSPERTYRYALARRWSDKPLIAWVMLNPSIADAFILDPTIRRCVGYARHWDAGGVLVLNLFGLRSTDPAALLSHPDPVGPDNDTVIAAHYSVIGPNIGPTIVAWGAHPTVGDRADHVLDLLRARDIEPLALGTTKDGWPRHPLYLRSDATCQPYHQPAEMTR